jgi:hypothetical protein
MLIRLALPHRWWHCCSRIVTLSLLLAGLESGLVEETRTSTVASLVSDRPHGLAVACEPSRPVTPIG